VYFDSDINEKWTTAIEDEAWARVDNNRSDVILTSIEKVEET
jgi:hypothetical protein